MKHKNIILGLLALLFVLIIIKVIVDKKEAADINKVVMIERPTSYKDTIDIKEKKVETTVFPTVPENLSGEDSIAYIENYLYNSPITANDLLKLAEVHTVESRLFYYNNRELVREKPEYADRCIPTRQDTAAMRLANRFMRMLYLVSINGNANDKLEWTLAVNAALHDYCKTVPTVPLDSAVNEITRVVNKFSSYTQSEMNFQCYIYAAVEDYHLRNAYRQWLSNAPYNLKDLVIEEYETWNDLNEARFAFWANVSYNQEWYSMKPMEGEGYYQDLVSNRRKELMIEQEIILKGRTYKQKGVTVKTKEWEEWITDHSVPEDYEYLIEYGPKDLIPSDSVVAVHVDSLKKCFNRWLKARQAIAVQLPSEQGKSYDNLTADIHSMMIGKLDSIEP